MPRALYYTYMHRALEHHLTRAVVRVAYPAEYEENGKVYSGNTRHIIGFILADPSDIGLILHYLYVRRDYTKTDAKTCYRNQGIARALLEGMMRDYEMKTVTFTVWGPHLRRFDDLYYKVTRGEWSHMLSYNPFLFETLLPDEWETGVVATLDSKQRQAFRLQEDFVPIALK